MTVFSFGAGQESIYLLHKIATDPEFRKRHVVSEPLLVVGSDTGDEHPHTYESVEWAKGFCREHGIEFYWVTSDMGFHSRTWQSLTGQYKLNSGIGSAAFIQTCTDNLKIKVVDNFVEAWLKKRLKEPRMYRKSIYRASGFIKLIIGYAKGEETRIKNGNKFDPKWKQEMVKRKFPLIEEGIDRQACIDYNELHIGHKVWPSNCMRCFYQSDQEVLWLFRFHPAKFQEWVEMEQAKLEKWKGAEKNYGVYGKITLMQKLEKAQKLYGHWTDDELNEYKFSHGHCIRSKY